MSYKAIFGGVRFARLGNSVLPYEHNTLARGRPKLLKASKYFKPATVFRGDPILAHNYKDSSGKISRSVVNWWMSEKFDGYRAIWNGRCFKSRTNKTFSVPRWFSQMMPQGVALDGELWLGRGNFEKCGLFRKKRPKNAHKRKKWEDEWANSGVVYKVFDIPNSKAPFEIRTALLRNIVKVQYNSHFDAIESIKISCFPLEFVQQILVTDRAFLEDSFATVIARGGEGVMLRAPSSLYEQRRSFNLLKYKIQADTECLITGYVMSQDNTDTLAAFVCKFCDNGPSFNVAGIKKDIKLHFKETHPLQSVITIQHNGYTLSGKPRHPRYLRRRYVV